MEKSLASDPLTKICTNQHVILQLPSNNCKIVNLTGGGVVSLGKFGSFNVDEILGYPLGTTFEIYYDESEVGGESEGNGSKNAVGKIRVLNESTDDGDSAEVDVEIVEELANVENSANNQNLINVGNIVQKLSMSEIEEMKKQTKSTNEIISKIIESHGTFHKKTIHSQEKYLKRKKQKFARHFTVEYLSSSGLLKYLLEKGDVQRVMDMSQETIGMLLNLANIQSSGSYLCVDDTGGLLVYFLLERMFGGNRDTTATGKIIMVHENEHPNLDLLKFSDYSPEFIKEHVITVSILDFFEPPTVEEVNENFKVLDKKEVFELKGNKKNSYYRHLKLHKTQLQLIEYATNVQFDGLIVASLLSLPSLIPRLSEKVHGSRTIVCYSQFKETLLELSHVLYDDLRFLAPSILETRCRPYQTIRGKLHPLMTMRGGGGYLLWCHRVIPADVPPLVLDDEDAGAESVKRQKTE